MEFNTLLLHGKSAGNYPDGATLPPIVQSSAFRCESAGDHEKIFAHKKTGFAYTRIGNPTVAAFENRLNELEGGSGTVASASGMSAIASTVLTIAEAGDEVITSGELYGGTLEFFKDIERLGIKTHFLNELTPESIEKAANGKTRLIFGEFVSNPSLKTLDIPSLSEAAHKAGVPLVIDSTTVTPYTAKPLLLGADIVIHSSSKYLNGGGNSIGGAIVDGAKFKWDFEKFTALGDFKKYGNFAFQVRLRTDTWANFGGCLSPMNAYMNVVGMETLGLRMERICENAMALAKALQEAGVSVNYLGLPEHVSHGLCKKYLNGNGGGILTFRAGTKQKAFRVLDSLKYVQIISNIGDIRTLAIHPASTIFVHNPVSMQEAAGVFEDTIRVSVGIEDKEDIIQDFLNALEI